MEKLNYNYLLNLTLSVLLVETSNSHIEYNTIFNKENSLISLSNRDKHAIIEKLINDGYVKKMEISMASLNNYYITLEGILFINSGGYISQQNKERRLKFWSYTKNVLLVLGTVSAFILAIIEIREKTRDKSELLECKTLSRNIKSPNNILLKQNHKTIEVCCPK